MELTDFVDMFQNVAYEGYGKHKIIIKDKNGKIFNDENIKIYKNDKDKTVEIIFQEHNDKKVNDTNELEKEYEKLINDYEMLDNCNRIHENEIIEAKKIIKDLLKNTSFLCSCKYEKARKIEKQAEQFIKG